MKQVNRFTERISAEIRSPDPDESPLSESEQWIALRKGFFINAEWTRINRFRCPSTTPEESYSC